MHSATLSKICKTQNRFLISNYSLYIYYVYPTAEVAQKLQQYYGDFATILLQILCCIEKPLAGFSLALLCRSSDFRLNSHSDSSHFLLWLKRQLQHSRRVSFQFEIHIRTNCKLTKIGTLIMFLYDTSAALAINFGTQAMSFHLCVIYLVLS